MSKVARRKHPETEHASVHQVHEEDEEEKKTGVGDRVRCTWPNQQDVFADNAELRLRPPV